MSLENNKDQEFQEIKKRKIKKTLDPLETLNKQQYKAAVSTNKNNLVIASAGTGKTSTIIGRVSYLLSHGIKPSEILLLTFTSKAGIELKERLEGYFPASVVADIFAGTFHSFGLKMASQIANRKINISSQNEINTFLLSILQEVEGANIIGANNFLARYNLYLNKTAETVMLSSFLKKSNLDEETLKLYDEIHRRFKMQKEKHRIIDFNDLLLATIDYFKENKCPYKHVIVDEYQDSNFIQNEVLKSMQGVNLFCVGDYDQSIYAFNGADVSFIKNFTKEKDDAKFIVLEKNYRSAKPILDLAEKVIKNNERLYPKKLIVTKREAGSVNILKHENEAEEISFIINEIMKNANRIPYKDIAILFRSNATGMLIEEEMLSRNIPCIKKGDSSFLEIEGVSFLVEYYKICRNNVHISAFLSLFQRANLDIAKAIFENIMYIGNGNFISGLFKKKMNIATIPNKNFFNKNYNSRLPAYKKYASSDAVIHKVLNELEEAIVKSKAINNPATLLAIIMKGNINKQFLSKDDEDKTLEQRQKKLLMIFQRNNDFKTIGRMLSNIKNSKSDEHEENGVSLLTVHASKGLEFKNIHIVNLNEGKFPSKFFMKKGAAIEEERRLFYVAVTRAKEELNLHYCSYDKKGKDLEISSFLREGGICS